MMKSTYSTTNWGILARSNSKIGFSALLRGPDLLTRRNHSGLYKIRTCLLPFCRSIGRLYNIVLGVIDLRHLIILMLVE